MQITHRKGIFTIEGYSKSLQSPFFFPSISSIQAEYAVYDYFQLIRKTSYPALLISAYDLYHHEKRANFVKEISALSQNSFFVLMDSGHYEASWRADKTWTFNKFQEILKDADMDLCFSFDVYYNGKKKIPEHVKEIIEYTAMTGGKQKSGITIPIIHGTSQNLPSVVSKVVEGINPEIIGITERELGYSLLERASNLKLIRQELNKMKRDIAIHLLGTGNPASLLIYSLCGANFFDALEWCKNVVNPVNGQLYHFAQMDLIDCDCKVCKIKDIPYPVRVTSHNLLFYEKFTDEIRESITNNKVDSLVKKYLPEHIISKIKHLFLRT